MGLNKRTYALPEDTLAEFESAVPRGKRSAMVASLLREWLEERKREKIRRGIVEGCKEMAAVYLETEAEYHPLEEEVAHGGNVDAKTRRRRSRASGSR